MSMGVINTRREFLTAASVGLVSGLAGCESGGNGDGPDGETPDGTTGVESETFGIAVKNRLAVENFEASPELSGPKPAVIHVRVNNLDPDDDTTYFQKSLELSTGESKVFSEAFTVEFDRTMYAISAELEPFVDGGIARDENRKAGYTFTAGSDQMPTIDPIEISVVSFDRNDSEALFPIIGIHTGSG